MEITFKRTDGSFVGVVNGMPYHIIQSDPLFDAAIVVGANAPFERVPALTAAAILTKERSTMTCSPLQGILTLGESQWNKVLSYRDNYASWQEKVIIDSAQTWVRNSQNIAFFQYLLNFTPEQVDDLFRTATLIDA